MAAPEVVTKPRPAWHYWIALLATVMVFSALVAFSYAITGVGRARPGFLGTNARLLADLNLVMQIAMAGVLIVGFFFIRRGNWRAHKFNQTIVVLTNLVFITFVMVNTLVTQVLPERGALEESRIYLPMIHGLMGLVTEGLGIYLVLRMNDLLPPRWRVRNFKRVMQITLSLWLLTTAVGVGVYATLYARPSTASTPAAVGVVPTAAPAPTTAPPTQAPAPTAAPAVQPATTETKIGSAIIRDNFATNDQLVVTLANLPSPETGQVYAGWLTGFEGTIVYPVGTISPGSDGGAQISIDAPRGENFMAQYDGFLITLEPKEVPPTPRGRVVAWGQVSLNAMESIRRLLVADPSTPNQIGLAVGLRDQVAEVLHHAHLARDAAQVEDLASVQRHTEHVVLLIEGPKGPNYRDLDGDGKILDPSDGYGLLPSGTQTGYLRAVAEVARQATEAQFAGDLVKVHGEHVQIAAANTEGWLSELRAVGLTVFGDEDVVSAFGKVQQMAALADRALNGFDANSNETVEPIAGEAGARLAYQHAHLMAEMPLTIYQTVQLAPQVAVVPTPLPDPTATATLPPPEPLALTVPMVDFGFVPRDITVKVGTTVTFVNQDNAPHTATADGAEFDTGLIGANKSGEITFDTVGTFKYFCEFHGGPNGQGMAGTITVEP